MTDRPVSIVIPNWNGAQLLGPCLESVRRALETAGYAPPWDIIVADDGSTDGSVEMLQSLFPSVRTTGALRRAGFIANASRGIELCSNPHFLLLNNDVVLDEAFFMHWQSVFDDPDVFSVTSRLLRPDGVTFDSGRRVGLWDRGLIRHWVVCATGKLGPSLYGSGGASFYDAARFRALGGLDELYRPMYSEDLDLSYCAWKRGWKTIYQPDCLAYHQGSVSSRRAYSARQLYEIIAKNHFLFIWKNITDAGLFRQHLSWLPFWLGQGWRPGRRVVTSGFFRAVPYLKEALRKRALQRAVECVSDRDIWAAFRPTTEDLAHSPYMGLAGTA